MALLTVSDGDQKDTQQEAVVLQVVGEEQVEEEETEQVEDILMEEEEEEESEVEVAMPVTSTLLQPLAIGQQVVVDLQAQVVTISKMVLGLLTNPMEAQV